MKKAFVIMLLATIISSCGSKKSSTEAKKETVEATTKSMEIGGRYTILELNGKRLTKEDVGDKIPTMLLDTKDMKYSTSIGCNQINGKFSLEGNSIKFMPGMATMMACPNNLESTYLAALDKVDNYKIENFMLKVYQGDELKIIFQPMRR